MEKNSLGAWSQARIRFCEGLTSDEAVLFSTANLESVVEEAKRPILKYQPGKITHGIDSVVAAIAQYGDALDVLSNTAPFIMSPLWGGLRVLLHLASEYGIYFEKLLKMFNDVGDVLPRLKTYEKLFPNNERLRANISNAYLDILKFCTSAKHTFRRKHPSTLYLNVLFRSTWRPFQKEFGNTLDTFRQHLKTIEREAGLSHMLEADKDRKLEEEARYYLQKRHKAQERTRLLGLLSNVPWKTFHHRQQRLRHKGTGLWLRDTAEFSTWFSAGMSTCLSCCGIPGAGKTVLCSSIIDYVRCIDTKSIVAYHYFDYQDQKTMSITCALGSIIQQILLSTNVLPESLERALSDIYVHDLATPIPDDLMRAFCLALEIFGDGESPTYIFIDGVDECDDEARKELLLLITKLMEIPKRVIKVFMSSRDNERIMKTLGHFPCVKLLEAQLSGDIVIYVKDTVRSFIMNGLLVIENPGLEQEIVFELISKARGMFLWVYLQLEEICDNTHSDASIRKALQELPIGLEATYERIMERIRRQTTRQRKIAESILEWVICAKRTLTISELKEAIFLEPTQKSWDDSKIPGDQSHSSLIQTCCNLVVLDDYDGTVRLAHHTAETFLTSVSTAVLTEKEGFFPIDKASKRIKDMCIAYLMFSDFEMQLTQTRPMISLAPLEVFASASVTQMTGVLGITPSISNTFQLLKGNPKHRSHPEVHYGKFVEERVNRHADCSLFEKYSLLNYVINNWIGHVLDLATDSSTADANYFKSLRYLAFEKQAPFSFKPWDWVNIFPDESPKSDLPHLRLFDWAIENGHFALLRLLNVQQENSLQEYISYARTRYDHKKKIERIVRGRFGTMAGACFSALEEDNQEMAQLTMGLVSMSDAEFPILWFKYSPQFVIRLFEGKGLDFKSAVDVTRFLEDNNLNFGSAEDAVRCATLCAAHGLPVEISQGLLKDTTRTTRPRSLNYACAHGFLNIIEQLLEINSYCLEELVEAIFLAGFGRYYNVVKMLFSSTTLSSLLVSRPPPSSEPTCSPLAMFSTLSLAHTLNMSHSLNKGLVDLFLEMPLFRLNFHYLLVNAIENNFHYIVMKILEVNSISYTHHQKLEAMNAAAVGGDTEMMRLLLRKEGQILDDGLSFV